MIPLSEKLRPKSFKEIEGQDQLKAKDGFLQKSIESKIPYSILLFGPPGCGKTTIARLYAASFKISFQSISAIFNGIGEIKKIITNIQDNPLINRPTILFVDEIHRFNKSQQDIFLPFIEDGTLILIGATTENPSFVLNNALLSRLRVLKLNSLSLKALDNIFKRYERKNPSFKITKEARDHLIKISNGDSRHLLNMIENLSSLKNNLIDREIVENLLQKKFPLYDRDGENHYNLISALHKSIRGSCVDASLYWLSRMLDAKEDPLFILRRLIRIASEDIGLADPEALNITINAYKAFTILGSPEGELSICQAVVYLSLAPKSNALYTASNDAMKLAEETNSLPPPLFICNAPTKLMKNLGYGKDYIYDHDLENAFSGQNYFPKEMQPKQLYSPKNRGFEREMKKRIEYFSKLKS